MKNFIVGALFGTISLMAFHGGEASAAPGIAGYLNPATGTFTPYIQKVPAAAPVATTGTVTVAISLNIEAAIGADEPISCSVSISTYDTSFGNSASSTGIIARSGAKGSATIAIPYQWTMKATGEMANVSASCTEGSSYSAGGIGHSVSFTVPGFVVPTKPATVTKISLAASM